MSIAKIINLPTFADERGFLSVVENNNNFPFDLKRVFYLFGINKNKKRGGHAHIECHQLLIPISGSFKVKTNDGKSDKIFYLNDKSKGLYVPPLIWAEEFDFSKESVCLVITSHTYDKKDYINNLNDLKNIINEKK
tara:strand:+ start:1127 stop:1534 length:408 start_codon:yes stop_codon:yes gene_type:complete